MSAFADSAGYMDKATCILPCCVQPIRCGGEIELQMDHLLYSNGFNGTLYKEDYVKRGPYMRFSLVPHRLFADYTQITPELLQSRGIRLLLSDLDFTLAPKSVRDPDERIFAWIQSLKAAGIQVMILSNNRSPVRVERFCKDLGITYVGHAGKPSARGFREAMEKAGVTEKETAMLGDKLLTDVLGARRAGVWALMVEPLGGAVGPWQKVLHALQAPFKAMRKE